MTKYLEGFTLAEVLITLGVIGVVAAMTMPVLVQNYQKKLVVTRLKHFSSTMQQAAQLREKDKILGSFEDMGTNDVRAFNGEDMEKFFNHYWRPYIKVVNVTKMTKGLFVTFPNGAGAYMQRDYLDPTASVPTVSMYMIFCPQYRYCEDIDNKSSYRDALDTQHVFVFWQEGVVPNPKQYDYTRDDLKRMCGGESPYWCSSLIQYDGWDIRDDYPW